MIYLVLTSEKQVGVFLFNFNSCACATSPAQVINRHYATHQHPQSIVSEHFVFVPTNWYKIVQVTNVQVQNNFSVCSACLLSSESVVLITNPDGWGWQGCLGPLSSWDESGQLKTALSYLDSQLLGEKRVSYSQNFELPLYEICKASSKLFVEYLFVSFGCMV